MRIGLSLFVFSLCLSASALEYRDCECRDVYTSKHKGRYEKTELIAIRGAKQGSRNTTEKVFDTYSSNLECENYLEQEGALACFPDPE